MAEVSRRTLLVGLLAAAAPLRAVGQEASTIALKGMFRQGGLIVGQAAGAKRVAYNGEALMLDGEGRFAFGFGRDEKGEARVDVAFADGRKDSRVHTIEAREYQIQRIDGLPEKYVEPPPDALARIERDNHLIGAARARRTKESWFAEDFDWPAHGIISGVYGSQRILNGEPKRPHYGVDIAAGEGSDVHAPLPSIVAMAEPDMYYTGGTVILDHGQGISTSYLHMKQLDVKVGDVLARGAVIGAVGMTGRATGPHLCWRLNWFQERLDPQLAAPPMPA